MNFLKLAQKTFKNNLFKQNLRFNTTIENKFKFTFASGDQKIFDGIYVNQVDVSSTDGDFGILKNHVPVMVELLPSVVTVKNDNNIEHFFISSGFVSVGKDTNVQIFAADVSNVKDLDKNAAENLFNKYKQKADSCSAVDNFEEKNFYLAASDIAKRIINACNIKF